MKPIYANMLLEIETEDSNMDLYVVCNGKVGRIGNDENVFKESLSDLRQTHDCRDMDLKGKLPVFVFEIFEKVNGQWEKVSDHFYADTPEDAAEQASTHLGRTYGIFKIKCVKACNYFVDGSGPHIILDKHTRDLISNGAYYQHDRNNFPSREEFIEKTLQRREEMKAEGLL